MEMRESYGAAIRPQTLVPFEHGWAEPTAAEVRQVLTKAGLSGSQAAKVLGIQSGRTIRRWTTHNEDERVPIPYSAWAILCHLAGYGLIWTAAGTGSAGQHLGQVAEKKSP